MADLLPQDRLQPALLDRLEDNEPSKKVEAVEQRVLSKNDLREAVLRDLTWLLNATRPPESEGLAGYADVERSVLNFGMPSFSGETASSINIHVVERAVRDALVAFEPRIVAETLRVEAVDQENVLDWHNVISLRISGTVWAQPVPLELILRTALDLESGQVELTEISAY
jgi:type VI secretion system protein ImpF